MTNGRPLQHDAAGVLSAQKEKAACRAAFFHVWVMQN